MRRPYCRPILPALALVLGPVLGLSACTTTAGEPLADGARPECRTDGTASFIGQPATSQTGAQIREITRASIFHWVAEGSAVTMDYRPERVRVEYDSAMKITRITCG
ncbi:I78 family peptidase inhibitor [Qipengyuania marisflavi]|uniref:Peptidase inhibitor I78 n=1 Tax=Qipengyuania marisflavi TaxID=2486356 RepID=A0A5S3P2Y0_9SPHN|nr:I78 family peptidase inhibitor [Qipengyuania marisflavi]TMM47311.1 peptidase inhibitor I78 [Qipengyuania marisflavi]